MITTLLIMMMMTMIADHDYRRQYGGGGGSGAKGLPHLPHALHQLHHHCGCIYKVSFSLIS